MSDPSLRERLENTHVPADRPAQRRGWAVAQGAFGERTPRSRRRPIAAAGVTLALVAALTTVALTPPGAAVADWVQRVLGDSPPPPRTTLGPLPGGGRMLVTASGRVWIVEPDGTRRSIARGAGATWSPRGLFVASWRGTKLTALAPDGRVAWSQDGLGVVTDARWSPDGNRVAYRRGGALWMVAGDGSGARVIDGNARPVPAAWLPGAGRALSWVDARGHVTVREPDSGRLVWRSARAVRSARRLAWSVEGRRVAVIDGSRARVFDRLTGRVSAAAWKDGRVSAAAWAPSGGRLAMIVQAGAGDLRSLVVLGADGRGERRLFTASRLGALVWSPAGRTLLVSWPHADQWLFVPLDARRRLSAVGGLTRRFGGQPTAPEWCCTATR